jgi:hypothetical protein
MAAAAHNHQPIIISTVEGHQFGLILRVKDTETFSAILVGPYAQERDGTFTRALTTHHTGNKSDVDTHPVYDWNRKAAEREVTHAEGAALARKLSVASGRPVPFIETSAKLNSNVTTAFAGISPPAPALTTWPSVNHCVVVRGACVVVCGACRAGAHGTAEERPGWPGEEQQSGTCQREAHQVFALLRQSTHPPSQSYKSPLS